MENRDKKKENIMKKTSQSKISMSDRLQQLYEEIVREYRTALEKLAK